MQSIEEKVQAIVDIAEVEQKKTIFLIGNTAKIHENDFYITPIRNYSQSVVTGVIVYSENIAKKIINQVDGKVDFIFVDAEKKIEDKNSILGDSGNIERAVKEEVRKSIFISYKANDMTVDAADAFISEYYSTDISGVGGKKVAVIGAGNLGSKLALKLVERGANVYLYRRDTEKLKTIVESINVIKPLYTDANAHLASSIESSCENADVIIGMTEGIAAIDENVIKQVGSEAHLIDVGKGSISRKALTYARSIMIPVYRLSIESVLEGLIESLIATHSTYRYKTGRKKIQGIKIVSGGLVADDGEVVVDNYRNPQYLYGVGNGVGDFKRDCKGRDKDNMSAIAEYIRFNRMK